MHIQKQLPQFEKERALFVVCGRQVAEIYFAYKGKLDQVESVKYETPKYSDKEGHNIRVRGGKVQRGGGVREQNKHDVVEHFIKKLQESLSRAIKKNKASSVYFFAPQHYQTEIINKLTKSIQNKIQETYSGNYVGKHPFFLLEKQLQSDMRNRKAIKVVVETKEVRKILRKSRLARKVIKKGK